MISITPFKQTDYVRPICLPENENFEVQHVRSYNIPDDCNNQVDCDSLKPKCVISGWGTTEKGSKV